MTIIWNDFISGLVLASGKANICGTLDFSEIATERKQEPVMRSLRREIYGLTFDLIRSERE